MSRRAIARQTIPNGSVCNDGQFCTESDSCSSGICQGGGDPCPGPDGDSECWESCDESANDCTAYDGDGVPCQNGYCEDGDCEPSECYFTVGGAVYDDLGDPIGSGVEGVQVCVSCPGFDNCDTTAGAQGLWQVVDAPCGECEVSAEKGGCTFQHVEGGVPGDSPPIIITVDR